MRYRLGTALVFVLTGLVLPLGTQHADAMLAIPGTYTCYNCRPTGGSVDIYISEWQEWHHGAATYCDDTYEPGPDAGAGCEVNTPWYEIDGDDVTVHTGCRMSNMEICSGGSHRGLVASLEIPVHGAMSLSSETTSRDTVLHTLFARTCREIISSRAYSAEDVSRIRAASSRLSL